MMTEEDLLRRLLLRMSSCTRAKSPLADAMLAWAKDEGRRAGLPAAKNWTELKAALGAEWKVVPESSALGLAQTIAGLFALDEADRALLLLATARSRVPSVAALLDIARRNGLSPAVLLAELVGEHHGDPLQRWRSSATCGLGLAMLRNEGLLPTDVELPWLVERLFSQALSEPDEILALLVGAPQLTGLTLADFSHVASADLIVRLLAGARREGAKGINILVHGPPGTGKTELARAVSAAASLRLYSAGEHDEDQDEPTRYDRVFAYRRAQRLLANQARAVLLFDEMEDLIGDVRPSAGDLMIGRSGSKVFVNRLLEENPVPTIWVTNVVDNIDAAILRRMSFVLELDYPTPAAATAMAEKIADDESVTPDGALLKLVASQPDVASVLRVSTRAARLAGCNGDAGQIAASLVGAIRGEKFDDRGDLSLDLGLYEADQDIEALIDRIASSGIAEVSLLLSGPPGTGKTILAHHLARRLDRPLETRRASDLLSKWVGGTERAIAHMFSQARARNAVLLLDEADSLLADRAGARASWEVTQVNELLTWLDHHPLPVIAATNRSDMLDPAALRRFLFKLELRPLGRDKARLAYRRFFSEDAPHSLDQLVGLTPSDFANVARRRRLMSINGGAALVAELALELAGRPECGARIGF